MRGAPERRAMASDSQSSEAADTGGAHDDMDFVQSACAKSAVSESEALQTPRKRRLDGDADSAEKTTGKDPKSRRIAKAQADPPARRRLKSGNENADGTCPTVDDMGLAALFGRTTEEFFRRPTADGTQPGLAAGSQPSGDGSQPDSGHTGPVAGAGPVADSGASTPRPPLDLEKTVANIKEACLAAKKATSREGSSKLSFRREDQNVVRDAMDVIFMSSMDLITEIQKLHQEIASLKTAMPKNGRRRQTSMPGRPGDAQKPLTGGAASQPGKAGPANPPAASCSGGSRAPAPNTWATVTGRGTKPTGQSAGTPGAKSGPKSVPQGTAGAAHTLTNGAKQQTGGPAQSVKKITPRPDQGNKKVTARTIMKDLPKPHETIIRVEGKSAEEVKSLIKEKLKVPEIGGPLKGIFVLGQSAIMLRSRDEAQKTKLEQALAKHAEFAVNGGREYHPTVTICGVDAKMRGEELIEAVYAENECINTKFSAAEYAAGIRFQARRPCKNKERANVTLTAQPEIAKTLIAAKKISVGWLIKYVEEEVHIVRCYNCSAYGHVQTHCQRKMCCPKCGGEHRIDKCKAEQAECPNCKRAKKSDTGHKATNPRCPVYKKKLEEKMSRTTYG